MVLKLSLFEMHGMFQRKTRPLQNVRFKNFSFSEKLKKKDKPCLLGKLCKTVFSFLVTTKGIVS